MARACLTLLGGFEARLDDGTTLGLPTHKYKALLAFLATPPGQAHPRDKLVAMLWGELPREQGRAALRQALWALRKALDGGPPRAIVLEDDTVRLEQGVVRVDVTEFERAARSKEAPALAQAVELYRGEFLAGIAPREAPFEEWLIVERERLAELAVDALARLLVHQRAEGARQAAIATAQRLLALDPLQEAVHRTLMELHTELGRQGAALRQYQTCVSVLQRELAVEPEAETRALYQDILRRRGSGGPPSADRRSDEAPRRTGSRSAGEAPATDGPFVGRQLEITLLREALDEVTRGRGQVVAVLGEAGIGKSRLTGEIATEAGRRGARVVFGRAYDSDQVLPLGVWADALHRAQFGGDPDTLATLRPACRAELGRLVPELGDPDRMPPAGSDSMQLFESVAQLVATLALQKPLIIVLDDLHWADDMSRRLFSFVARRVQGALPVLMMLTARAEEMPDALSRALDDLDRELPVLQLSLHPLGRDDTGRLARALAGSGRDAASLTSLAEAVWAASEGSPFMIVETLRALGDGSIAETPGTLPLPQRVRRLLRGRLDRLRPESRQLAAAAAIIGRDFDHALLQKASGLGEDEALEGLEELVRRRIVHAVGDRFDFSHDRIREVAYAELLPPRRRLLHRQVAEAIEALHDGALESHYASLGLHYREAEVWDKAARFLDLGGLEASRRAAFREGDLLAGQALDALARLPRSHAVLVQETNIRLHWHRWMYSSAKLPRLAENLERARELVETVGNERQRAALLIYTCEYQRTVRNFHPALEAGLEGLALARRADDRELEVEAHFQLGCVLIPQGEYRRAIGHLEAMGPPPPAALRRFRSNYPYAPGHGHLVTCLTDLGEFVAARRRGEEYLRLAEQTEHPVGLGHLLTAVGRLDLAEGRLDSAIARVERSLALSRKWQIKIQMPTNLAVLAHAHGIAGRRAEACALIDEAERDDVSQQSFATRARMVAYIGWAALHSDRPDTARRLATVALDDARATGERPGEAEALALLGAIATHAAAGAGRSTDAERLLSEALGIATDLGMRPLAAQCHRALGALHRQSGRAEASRAELNAAAALYRAMDVPVWLGRVEAELALVGGP